MNKTIDYKKLSIAGVVLLIIASLFLLVETIGTLKAFGTIGNDAKDSRAEISVSGTGDVIVIPNIATFTFSVIETGKTVQEAQTAATDLANKALAYLKNAGISDTDIKTTSYDITPRYEYSNSTSAGTVCYNCSGKQTLVGYDVSQSVEVKIHDMSQAGTILSGIGSLGVQNISGLTLTVDDQNAVTEQAREKAIADAKAQAQKLAQDLGVHLVRITSFEDQSSGYPMPYAKVAFDSAMGSTAAQAPQIPTGENKVTSTVTLTYEIR